MTEDKINQPEKRKFALWIRPSLLEEVDSLYESDNCASRSEFMEKALRFYIMSTEQTPVFFAAPKYPAMLSKLAKGRTESYGDSARGPTWQSHEQRFPAALQ